MIKKVLTTALSCLLIQAAISVQPASATSREAKQIQFAERVKTEIAKLGVGRDARVSVRLRDKARVAGYISEINENSFVVTNLETGAKTTVAYPAVARVQGQHIETGLRIALQAIGVVLGVILLWAIFAGPRD